MPEKEFANSHEVSKVLWKNDFIRLIGIDSFRNGFKEPEYFVESIVNGEVLIKTKILPAAKAFIYEWIANAFEDGETSLIGIYRNYARIEQENAEYEEHVKPFFAALYKESVFA